MNQPTSTVLEQFRRQLETDRQESQVRSLADYLRLFPGEEEALAREFLAKVATETPTLPEVGARLGHYHLSRELGRGGQGTVYLATDQDLGRQVALKVLDGFAAANPEVLARFRREAMAASALQHPGICAVYEARVEGMTPFIAMQLVPGETLAKRISSTKEQHMPRVDGDGIATERDFVDLSTNAPETEVDAPATESTPLSRAEVPEFVAIVEKAARALHAAHEAGVIHRDIKPGNLMVTPAGDPVILDFGLARQEDSQLETMTRVGDLFGTPAYMSPEQLSRAAIRMDARTDIWSLGVVLYECLAMRRPFEAPTREGLYQSILAKDPQDLTKANRNISRDLATVVAKALEKDRDRRYSTAEDFAEDLRRVRMNEPILARRVSALGRAWRWSKREPAKAALLALIAVTIPTVAAFVTSRIKDQPLVEEARRLRIQEEKEALLAEATYELSEGSAAKAKELFSKAIDQEGGSPEGAAGLAMAELKLGFPERALAVLDRYQEWLAGSITRPLVTRDALRKLQRDAEADAVEKAMPAPSTALDFALLAQRALVEGDKKYAANQDGRTEFENARRYSTHALLLHRTPRLDLLVMRAHVAGHLADPQTVVETAQALVNHFPHRAIAHHWAAFAYLKLEAKTYDEAGEAAAREAVRLDPSNANAHSHLGGALVRREQYSAALAPLKEAVRLAPKETGHKLNLVAALDELKLDGEAFAILDEVLAETPDHEMTLHKYGSMLIDRGREEEGMAKLRRMIEAHPASATSQALFGRALHLQSKWNEAIPYLKKGIEMGINDPGITEILGQSLMESGATDEALALLREIAEQNPGSDSALGAYARALSTKSEHEAAAAVIRKLVALKPDNALFRANLGRELCMLGRGEEALVEAREAVRLAPSALESQSCLGHALQVLGRLEEARGAYEAALAIDPKSSDTLYQLGAIFDRLQQWDASIESLKACLTIEPEHILANLQLGASLTNRGRPAEALEYLRTGTRLLPKDAYGALNLGITLNQLQKVDEAVVWLRKAIQLDPNLASAYSLLGGALGESGQISEALAVLRDGAERHPENPDILFTLAAAYMATNDFPKALEIADRSIKANPAHALAHYNRGNILFQLDRATEAIAAFQECLRLQPDHAEGHCNLGHALLAADRPAEALAAFRRGHELGSKQPGWPYPSADWIKEAEIKVKAGERDR